MNKELRGFFLFLFAIGFVVDAFFIIPTPDYGSDMRIFLLTLLWLFAVMIAKFKSTETFKLTLVFLSLLSFMFIFFRTHPSVERIASWVYIYLAFGVVQQLFESRKESS